MSLALTTFRPGPQTARGAATLMNEPPIAVGSVAEAVENRRATTGHDDDEPVCADVGW
jgi:hypothetical protein